MLKCNRKCNLNRATLIWLSIKSKFGTYGGKYKKAKKEFIEVPISFEYNLIRTI
jgi:hypothetical protein